MIKEKAKLVDRINNRRSVVILFINCEADL